MLQRLIGEDIALETLLDAQLGHVMADPDQLHQVIVNLAVNARDAMVDGGALEIATVNMDRTEAVANPGRYVVLRVTDNGCGMDEVTKQHIFEPFFTTKGIGKGTGLGLATVYGIVEQSGGFIEVSSDVGRELRSIFFPRLDGACAEQDGCGSSSEAGSETVLLVEDEKPIRKFAAAALREYGYCVTEAGDGKEALDVAAHYPGKIHLLMTDVVMPGMNGRELSERLKLSRPELKVLFISGYTADVLAHRGVLDRGFRCCISHSARRNSRQKCARCCVMARPPFRVPGEPRLVLHVRPEV